MYVRIALRDCKYTRYRYSAKKDTHFFIFHNISIYDNLK